MSILVSLEPLSRHFKEHNIEFLQFAFRWMNNLLMRELPVRCTIRLWDTYLVPTHAADFPSKELISSLFFF